MASIGLTSMDLTSITDEVCELIGTDIVDAINNSQAVFDQQRTELEARQLDTFGQLDAVNTLIGQQTASLADDISSMLKRVLPTLVPHATLWFKTDKRPATDWVWVVSPYAYNLMGQAMTSVALQQNDSLKIGILANFSTGELLTGVAGEGCWLDDTPCSVGTTSLPEANRSMLFLPPVASEQAERGIGAGKWSERIAAFSQQYAYPFRTNNVVENVAYYLGLLARNEIDFVMGVRFAYHDIAAGICLVEQAGGIVTDFDGQQQGLYAGDSFFAGNVDLHRQFMHMSTLI